MTTRRKRTKNNKNKIYIFIIKIYNFINLYFLIYNL